MGKPITEHKSVNILLAILIAVALWVYVTTVVNPGSTRTIYDVPVTVNGQEVLSNKGLMIDPATDLSMNLRVSGNLSALGKVLNTTNEILLSVDISGINSAGEHTLPCRVSLPNMMTSSTVTVENSGSLSIRVRVIKMLSKTVDVRGVFSGNPAEGYRADDFSINPSTITIQGPEELVNRVEFAQVTVSGTDLTKTFSGDLGFEYIGSQAEKISHKDITANVDTVNVILPVAKTLEVPLDVEILPGGGATLDNILSVEISPATIQISGEEEDVLALAGKSIKLKGVIDLSKDTSQPITLPITLAPELTNDSGVSEATVTIQLTGLESKTVETTNIEVINPPQGYLATPVTQSIQVRVRGLPADLAAVSDYQVRVVVDLKGQDFSPGQFRPQAKVYLDVDGQVGVVGDVYVVISITAE